MAANEGKLNPETKEFLEAEKASVLGIAPKRKPKGDNSKFVWLGFSVYRTIGKRSIIAKWAQEFRRAESLAIEAAKKAVADKRKGAPLGKVKNA